MQYEYKEVYYDQYCGKCKHRDVMGFAEPCNECLSNPVNLHSHKPVKFEEKENK